MWKLSITAFFHRNKCLPGGCFQFQCYCSEPAWTMVTKVLPVVRVRTGSLHGKKKWPCALRPADCRKVDKQWWTWLIIMPLMSNIGTGLTILFGKQKPVVRFWPKPAKWITLELNGCISGSSGHWDEQHPVLQATDRNQVFLLWPYPTHGCAPKESQKYTSFIGKPAN